MRLAEQWSEVQAELERRWETASLALTLADEGDAERAALVLGPAAPMRQDGAFRLEVSRRPRPVGTSAAVLARVLARLDREGVAGRLELVGVGGRPAEEAGTGAAGSLAGEWRAIVAALPADWSHALATVELRSTDFVDRAALRLSPLNPQLVDGRSTLSFRVARTTGYGASSGMAERCLARLDAERITGRVFVQQAVSEARPVATQGPVWRVGGRSV